MTDTERPWDGTDEAEDTEGHNMRAQYPIPPSVDGDGGFGRRATAQESTDEPDTEGHLQYRRRPGEAGER